MRLRINLSSKIPLIISTLLLLFISTCTSVLTEKVTRISYRDNQKEYKKILPNLDRNKEHVVSIKKDDITEFLVEFNKHFQPLFSDYRLLQWYRILNIGTYNHLLEAGKNLENIIELNQEIFWRLNNQACDKSDYELRRIKFWEKIFEEYRKSSNKESLDSIRGKINEIEDYILRNPIQDIDSLEKQENMYKKLFTLRNEYAKLKGYKNHLYRVYSDNEIKSFNELYNEIKSNLANISYRFEDIGGLVQSSDKILFPLLFKTVENMGLYIDKEKVKYYASKHIKYNHNFMYITKPKYECRIHIFLPDTKLYPDEFLSFIELLLHETGHGLHFQYIDQNPYIFHSFDHVIAEMVAVFFENIIYSKKWLSSYFSHKLSGEDIDIIINNRKASLIRSLQFAAFMWEFETSIYEDPDQDIEALHKFIRKELNIKYNDLPNLWYDTTVFASHDLFYTNYTLAYFYAFKLRKLVEKNFGERYFESPSCGQFLIDNIFKYGRAIERKELLVKLFGNTSLDINNYIKYLEQ